MFWFWIYRKPVRVCLRSAGAASAARKMCSHNFCRLCMRWVPMVCSPTKNNANPT